MRVMVAVALVCAGPGAVEWAVYGEGGQMQHLVPAGCESESDPVVFGGAGGALLARSASAGGWERRFTLDVTGDLRVGTLYGDDTERTVWLGRGSVLLGVSSRYVGFRAGVLVTNAVEDEDTVGLPAASLTFGPDDGFVRLSLWDQPMCFPADCALGVQLGNQDTSFGASLGVTSGRVLGGGRIRDLIGSLDLHVGGSLSFDFESDDPGFNGASLVIGVGDIAPLPAR